MNNLARRNSPMKGGLPQLTLVADKIVKFPRSLCIPPFLRKENREAWFETVLSPYYITLRNAYRSGVSEYRKSFCDELVTIIRFDFTPKSWSYDIYTLDEAVAILFIMDSASRMSPIL